MVSRNRRMCLREHAYDSIVSDTNAGFVQAQCVSFNCKSSLTKKLLLHLFTFYQLAVVQPIATTRPRSEALSCAISSSCLDYEIAAKIED